MPRRRHGPGGHQPALHPRSHGPVAGSGDRGRPRHQDLPQPRCRGHGGLGTHQPGDVAVLPRPLGRGPGHHRGGLPHGTVPEVPGPRRRTAHRSGAGARGPRRCRTATGTGQKELRLQRSSAAAPHQRRPPHHHHRRAAGEAARGAGGLRGPGGAGFPARHPAVRLPAAARRRRGGGRRAGPARHGTGPAGRPRARPQPPQATAGTRPRMGGPRCADRGRTGPGRRPRHPGPLVPCRRGLRAPAPSVRTGADPPSLGGGPPHRLRRPDRGHRGAARRPQHRPAARGAPADRDHRAAGGPRPDHPRRSRPGCLSRLGRGDPGGRHRSGPR